MTRVYKQQRPVKLYKCHKCDHFIKLVENHMLDRWEHIDDGAQIYDHMAYPYRRHNGNQMERTEGEWRRAYPELFVTHQDGKIGPNSPHHPNQTGKICLDTAGEYTVELSHEWRHKVSVKAGSAEQAIARARLLFYTTSSIRQGFTCDGFTTRSQEPNRNIGTIVEGRLDRERLSRAGVNVEWIEGHDRVPGVTNIFCTQPPREVEVAVEPVVQVDEDPFARPWTVRTPIFARTTAPAWPPILNNATLPTAAGRDRDWLRAQLVREVPDAVD